VSVDSLPGRNLGKYRLLEPLGRGGMARVYRAYHPQLDRYVAIKVLRSDLVEEKEFLGRFKREARAVAALRHPNIVQVFDFDVHDGLYYMVMELLEGDSLRTRLNDYRARDERMPLGDVTRILLDVLAGLAYAHSEGMIHRDVKPGNILLSKRGRAVLTDFGIAQIVGGTRYTVSGALMGTLSYMSPEQGMEGQCDARSDIYSLGIVFYEMLTGDPPFDAETPLAILMKHVNDPLPPPRKVESSIPKPFERIVLKSLAKRPRQRYQSAGEMAEALQKATQRAKLQLPERISLPLSFTTAEAPSESVAVLSGTAREKVVHVEFAVDDTDAELGQSLAMEVEDPAARALVDLWAAMEAEEQRPDGEQALYAEQGGLPRKAAEPEPVYAEAVEPISAGEAIDSAREALSGAGDALQESANVLLARAPAAGSSLEGTRTGRAILYALGLVAGVNLVVIFLGLFTGWWGGFRRGWPFEFLVVGAGLCLIMEATANVWLLIPTGIILGIGVLLSFCAITGLWKWWAFLWPLEPLLIIGTVLFTIWLADQGERGRQTARHLGRSLRRPALVLIPIVVLLGAIVG
jgi:tRNA A-37 threonylcarbamoyl transferase component Bud32